MIRMIPDSVDSDIKSGAEKAVFSKFQNTQSDELIIILHSLGIAEHTSNIFGEIDFVIICHEGLLCVEVKGGIIERTGANWTFTNRYGKRETKREGPFEQAQGNMHSLRNYLKKRLGENNSITRAQYASCVIMPECDFEFDGIDIIRDVLFDSGDPWNLSDVIKYSFTYWRQRIKRQHGFEGGYLAEDQIKQAADLLRGDFRFVPSLREQIDRISQELCALTAEQYDVLESLNENERMLISGMAGTGKTLLAIEQCRRAYWEGKKVLYLCFNGNMARYVKSRFDREGLNIDASTLPAFMMKVCDETWSPDKGESYYHFELPQKFLSNDKYDNAFDLIVIDEGQDLLNETYIHCLGKIMKSGLDESPWSFYYDPNQNIFNRQAQFDTILPRLKKISAAFYLSVNCRNTRQIANTNTLMTNIPQANRVKASGPNVEIFKYGSLREEQDMTAALIQKLKDDGINCGDIVLLSAYTADNPLSCMSVGLLPPSVGKIKQDSFLWQAKKNELRFSTIAAFKGLEAKVIIILDVDSFSKEDRRLLNYVAISRACSVLYVFYDVNAEDERQMMLELGYAKLQ